MDQPHDRGQDLCELESLDEDLRTAFMHVLSKRSVNISRLETYIHWIGPTCP